jgi:hypothetical protein
MLLLRSPLWPPVPSRKNDSGPFEQNGDARSARSGSLVGKKPEVCLHLHYPFDLRARRVSPSTARRRKRLVGTRPIRTLDRVRAAAPGLRGVLPAVVHAELGYPLHADFLNTVRSSDDERLGAF